MSLYMNNGRWFYIMELLTELKQILNGQGIDPTKYTDEQLQGLILQAKTLINREWATDKTYTDYNRKYNGDIITTDYYPLKTIETITINDEEVTPDYYTDDGIIYLPKQYNGTLKCDYTVGLTDDDYINCILPMTTNLILDQQTDKNIASINEGDVSISYNNTTTANTNDALIENIRNKYAAKIRMIP